MGPREAHPGPGRRGRRRRGGPAQPRSPCLHPAQARVALRPPCRPLGSGWATGAPKKPSRSSRLERLAQGLCLFLAWGEHQGLRVWSRPATGHRLCLSERRAAMGLCRRTGRMEPPTVPVCQAELHRGPCSQQPCAAGTPRPGESAPHPGPLGSCTAAPASPAEKPQRPCSFPRAHRSAAEPKGAEGFTPNLRKPHLGARAQAGVPPSPQEQTPRRVYLLEIKLD